MTTPTLLSITHGSHTLLLDVNGEEDSISEHLRRENALHGYSMLLDIERRLHAPGGVIDVGAHVGNHTLFFSAIMGRRVIALEPDTRNYHKLERNIALNEVGDLVSCLQVMAGDHATPEIPGLDRPGASKRAATEVRVVRLDDLASGADIALIRVDAVRMGIEAVRSASGILDRAAPLLYVEIGDKGSYDQVYDFLAKLQYYPLACFNRSPTFLFEKHTNVAASGYSATLGRSAGRLVFDRDVDEDAVQPEAEGSRPDGYDDGPEDSEADDATPREFDRSQPPQSESVRSGTGRPTAEAGAFSREGAGARRAGFGSVVDASVPAAGGDPRVSPERPGYPIQAFMDAVLKYMLDEVRGAREREASMQRDLIALVRGTTDRDLAATRGLSDLVLSLRTDEASLRATLEASERRVAALLAEQQSLQSALAKSEEQAAASQAGQQQRDDALKAMAQSLREAREAKAALEKQLSEVWGEWEKETAAGLAKSEELRETKAREAAASDEALRALQVVKELEERVGRAESQRIADARQARRDLEQLRIENQQLQRDAARNLSRQAEEDRDEIARVRELATAEKLQLEGALAKLKKSLHDRAEELESIKTKLAEAQETQAAAPSEEEIAELQAASSAQRLRITVLENEAASLQERLVHAKASLAQAQATLSAHDRDVATRNAEMAALLAKGNEHFRRAQDLETQLAAASRDLTSARATIAAKEREITVKVGAKHREMLEKVAEVTDRLQGRIAALQAKVEADPMKRLAVLAQRAGRLSMGMATHPVTTSRKIAARLRASGSVETPPKPAAPAGPAPTGAETFQYAGVTVALRQVGYEKYKLNLEAYLDRLKQVPDGKPLILMFSGTIYMQEERANRPIRLAKTYLDQGIPVIFSYFRWRESELIPDNYHPLLFQTPIDFTLKAMPMIGSYPVGARQRIFVVAFPYPAVVRHINDMATSGWITMYDARDDWEEFHKVEMAKWYNMSVEKYVLNSCDFSTAVSRPLQSKLQAWTPRRIHLSPNAFDRGFLKDGVRGTAKRRPEKVAGYFGHLTDKWFDWHGLNQVAKALPNWRFEIIGHAEPKDLKLEPNIELMGKRSHAEINQIAARWSVAMILFKINRLTEAVDPIKLYEYLALGLPTVSFTMPQIHDYPYTFPSASVEEFVANIHRAAATQVSNEEVVRFLSANTWEERAAHVLRTASKYAGRDGMARIINP